MKTPDIQAAPLSAEEIAAIKVFYGAWKEQQPDLLDSVCTPDWQDIPMAPGQADGPQGLKDIIRSFVSSFPDIEIIIHEIMGVHERAAVRAAITFTHDKAVLGIPPTHQKVSIPLHEFHYLKEGKLTHTWHMEDWFGLLVQSGAWTPEAVGK